MSVPNIEEVKEESYFTWDNPIETLLKEKQEAESPAEPAVDEGKTEEPQEKPAPTPQDDPWTAPFPDDEKELSTRTYPNTPEAHGWYKNKPLKEVDEGIRRLEGAKSEAEHRANLAEAKAAANEVALQMLQERMRKMNDLFTPPAQEPPKPKDAYEEAGITDFDTEWVMNPSKVREALERDILSKADAKYQARIEALQKQLDEKEHKKELNQLAAQFEKQAKDAAREVLTDLKIPQEQWTRVLDYVVPVLSNLKGPYADKGGVIEPANYRHLIENDPILKAGIAQLSGVAPKVEAPVASPPGVKAASAPVQSTTTYASSLSREVRDLAIQSARLAGITEQGPELEEFIEAAGARIAANRRRKGNK